MARPIRQEARPARDEITEVAPGILRLELPIQLTGLGHVNCYLLEDERGVAVVDPGLPGPEPWTALVAGLGRARFPLARVHSVIVTHSHPDHFGGAARLRDETGAEIVTHRKFSQPWAAPGSGDGDDSIDGSGDDGPEPEQHADIVGDEAIERARHGNGDGRDQADSPFVRRTKWGGFFAPPPIEGRDNAPSLTDVRKAFPRPTRRVENADVVRFARRDWVAVHTPGHTPDHLCLFDPEHGVMLSGDHVLPTITPHIGGLGDTDDALDDYLRSLQRVAVLQGVTVVLPAHGDPFTDLAGRVGEIGLHHEERLQKLVDSASALGRPATVAELMRFLFSERSWGSMAESETYAHLEHLRRAGRADAEWRDDYLWFSVRPEADARV